MFDVFMIKRIRHQTLPNSGPKREALREKGQFWTPLWVAEPMVAYLLANHDSDEVFDPAVGEGVFFFAAKKIATELGMEIRLAGREIDASVLESAKRAGLTNADLAHVELRDFLLHPPDAKQSSFICNPPYIRHHRLPASLKQFLRTFGASLLGHPLDGRAGIHVYFLLRALQSLKEKGRLAFIMPADMCEGVFAVPLWNWIAKNYRLDAVITFSPDATPFPGVDTNAIIFMICRDKPSSTLFWARCNEPNGETLKKWVLSGFNEKSNSSLTIYRRCLTEGLATGLSRLPTNGLTNSPRLCDFAKVLRGIATGANDFFFLTADQAKSLKISSEFLIPAVGRTRDANGDCVTYESMNELSKSGRPTLLFSPDGRPLQDFPDSVRTYLKQGEQAGLPARSLIASRKPWYKMERRKIPPILFAYLGRRNARFIRNEAGVTPLTGFLCVYPNNSDPDYVEKLCHVLSDPETVANLSLVGKSYGSGCIKVEPRALERLPIPRNVINRHNLNHSAVELALDWQSSAITERAMLVREAKPKYQAKQHKKPKYASRARRK